MKPEPELVFSFRGHNLKGTDPVLVNSLTEYGRNEIGDAIRSHKAMLRDIVTFKDNPELLELLTKHKDIFLSLLHRCFMCNGKLNIIPTDDPNVYTFDSQCTKPEPLGLQKVRLNIPSGRMVIGDDLRYIYDHLDPCLEMGNFPAHIDRVNYWAERCMLVLSCGNSCPCMYRKTTDPNHITIVGYGKKPKTKYIGSVCTDSWDFCAMDYERFHGFITANKMPDHSQNVIAVKAGWWEITYDPMHTCGDFDSAKMEWIPAPK